MLDDNVILVFNYYTIETPNGLRYWRWGGRGLCLGAEKTRSQNALDAESSPLGEDVQRTEEVQCTLC